MVNKMNEKFEQFNKCLYCGSDGLEYVLSSPDRFSKRDEIFSLYKCLNCGLAFQNPRVKEVFIGEYYGEGDDLGYYRIPVKKRETLFSKIKSFINKQALIQHFNYLKLGKKNIIFFLLSFPFVRIQKINSTPDFVVNGKLLEIGCSHGVYLKKLQDYGWNVVGLEMDKKMTDYAKSLGLDVSSGRIEEADFHDSDFDVVLMNMVLEHLYNPFENLKKITSWMKPNGQLIFSIPYFNGIEFKIFKEYTYALQLPHHITFLNKKIIREYLTKLGYRNIKFYFQFFDRDVVTSAQFKQVDSNSYLYKLLGGNKFIRYLFIKPIIFLLSLFHMTSRVTVYADKL